MAPVATAALLLWPVIAIALFATLPRRRALLITVIGGFLFLPAYAITLPTLPRYDTTAAIAARNQPHAFEVT